jgi:hypothetical protein
MCDPVSLSIASAVIGAGGSAMNAIGASNAQRKQKQEYQNWVAQQRQFREQENIRQEDQRKQAEAAQQAALGQVGAQGQTDTQTAEEARLKGQLTTDTGVDAQAKAAPTSVADKSIASPQAAADTALKGDLARKMNEATADVRQRIKSLARVSSYGGSFGGLQNTNAEALGRSGSEIDRANEFRRGSLAAYGLEKSIDPVQVTYTPSPIADIFSSALSFGAQGLGNVAGQKAFGSFPSAPTIGSTFVGPPRPLPPYLQTTQGVF